MPDVYTQRQVEKVCSLPELHAGTTFPGELKTQPTLSAFKSAFRSSKGTKGPDLQFTDR